MAELTPMMQKYMETKEQYKDCILFYRLGDFYEMFFDDAIVASKELEIALTGKSCGLEERAPMCGIPYHAVETYLARLVSRGYKVAICEQVEDPKLAKGLVKREVIRVVTPGTNLDVQSLEASKNNYLMCIAYTSVYGNTEKAAERLAEQLKALGCPKIAMNNLALCDPAEAVEDAFRYGKLVLASPTYNGDVFPFMKHFIDALIERNYQNRTIGLIENGSWAPIAAKKMRAAFEKSRNITFTDTTVTVTSALNDDSCAKIDALAKELCR